MTGDNSGDELDNDPSAAPAWSLQQSINLTTMNSFPESLQLNSLSHVVNGMPASMAASSITTLTSSTVVDGENVE